MNPMHGTGLGRINTDEVEPKDCALDLFTFIKLICLAILVY